jgi:hypothetical protein
MKAWMTTLAALLGLSAATARADEPAPVRPVAVIAGNSCGSGCGSCNSGGTACQGCNSCQKHCDILAWALFCPDCTKCYKHPCYPRSAPIYAYFLHYGCVEGSSAYGHGGCGSCGCSKSYGTLQGQVPLSVPAAR